MSASARRLTAVLCALLGVLAGLLGLPLPAHATWPSVPAVSLSETEAAVSIHVGIAGEPFPRYRVRTLSDPARLVVDLHRTTLAWRGGPLRPEAPPVREVRASQWALDTARVVVELTERVPYRIEPRPDGLVVLLERPGVAQRSTPRASAAVSGSATSSPSATVGSGDDAGSRVIAQAAAQRPTIEPAPAQRPEIAQATPGGVGTKPEPAPPPATTTPRFLTARGHVEAGGRFYLNDRNEGLEDDSIPLEALLDFRYRFTPETQLRLRPRVAVDPLIPSRNRYEPLDAYVEHATPSWSLLAGQLVENWAIVDTFNPADVLNRRDVERDFYDPDRLGEVMVRLRAFLPDAGVLEQSALAFYLLPLHRETPLPSNRDRFRLDVTGDNRGDLEDDAIVASPDVAYAARLSTTIERADLFLFYFGGPTRIPSLDVSLLGEVRPVYYLVDIVGGGVQWAIGPWLLKLEAAQTFTRTEGLRRSVRRSVPSDYFQYVVGVDRTFYDVLGKNEVTFTLEYAGEDDPGETSLTGLRPYKSDVFFGIRWAFNDARRTEIQASVAADVRVDEQLWLVKFGTTLVGNLRLLVVGQFVNRAPRGGRDDLTVFNVFPNNSNVHIALRYEF
ncbi:MAG TPA: AMIN domain-containing protein [Candidatus Tectomicrobia bacterium]|nr:AMIN domain-containing protein [Candidatus Tectomicrobia bacterium]